MTVKELLEKEPKARERSNKNRAIGRVIEKNFNLTIPIETLRDVVGEILTLDRQWRKTLEEYPELRGTDYSEGEKLSQDYQINKLGYELGANIKLFK